MSILHKIYAVILILLIFQADVFALSCPLTSNENHLKYKKNGVYLACDYVNGRLRYRDQRDGYETITVDYYSNGIPKEYNIRSKNMAGGLYIANKKFNPSGMLIGHYMVSGKKGFDCSYAGRYRLNCVDTGSGIDYSASVEYASEYDWNY